MRSRQNPLNSLAIVSELRAGSKVNTRNALANHYASVCHESDCILRHFHPANRVNKTRVILLLHSGFEEMEAVAPMDLLSRAGAEVCPASLTEDLLVEGRSGISIRASDYFKDLPKEVLFDAVILPGGPGINALRQHPELCAFLKMHHAAGKRLACICAAPLLLKDAGLVPQHYTAHPSTAAELPDILESKCVWDGTILTSRGAGTATEFGLALVEALAGASTRVQIAESICWSED